MPPPPPYPGTDPYPVPLPQYEAQARPGADTPLLYAFPPPAANTGADVMVSS